MVDHFAQCCFVKQALCIPSFPKSPFLTCGCLLPYDILRGSIWVISILTILANVLGSVARYKKRKQMNRCQLLLINNLAVSDCLMSIYLIILLSVDMYYKDYFPSYSESWRNSALCKIAGSVSILSSEASVFFVTLISIDRYLRVRYLGNKWILSIKAVYLVISTIWVFAVTISITTYVVSGIDSRFYTLSEICI